MSERSRYAGEPITDDDATIAAALEDVSIPTLLLSMVHMTGDAGLLDGAAAPGGHLPQRGAGLHEPRGPGGGAGPGARRDPRLPRRRAASSRPRPTPRPSTR